MAESTSDDESTWLQSIKVELREVTAPQISNWTICMVPNKLRNVNEGAYTPRVLSIGPAHYGKEELRSMEKQKLQYAQSLFSRAVRDTMAPFDNCAKSILELVNQIRGCYEESLTRYFEDKKLAKIMLIDGCFILELLLRYGSGGQECSNDPIFTTSWMISSLQRDLVLLENQIPFIVLRRLYQIVRQSVPDLSRPLNELALRFFKSALNLRISEEHNQINSDHLLDLIHKCHQPVSPRADFQVSMGASQPIECATALLRADIKFRVDTSRNLLDIDFARGVFRFPRFVVNDVTVAVFTNLVAFEQCCRGDAQYISSYIFLMDLLLNTAADVELLEHMRIIKNNLGSYEDLSVFLNTICKQIFLRDFYFEGLCQEVMAYYSRPWIRYMALLREHYFATPWVSISFIAATLLLVLTVVQTVISILSYNMVSQ